MAPDLLLDRICYSYCDILGENLVGVYLHGSLAFGCYHSAHSDIDFIVVVNRELTLDQKKAMIRVLLALEPYSPPKGLEMSVVLKSVCNPFVYPTPYELHYSNAYREQAKRDLEAYCQHMKGTDKDLAAHFTVIRKVGVALWGDFEDQVFGEVPHENYLDSLRCDVVEAIGNRNQDPVYMILNLCRVLAYREDGRVLSKREGGEWGRVYLPEHFQSMINRALATYIRNEEYEAEPALEKAFAVYMKERIFSDN